VAHLEPWILLRLLAGLVATVLFLRAGYTAVRVLRRFDAMRATEGQLALERQVELASTFVRVGAATQIAALVLSVLGADKLSHGIRGAMCAYGTYHANEWGFPALYASLTAAFAAALLSQLYLFDMRIRGPELVRTLAVGTLLVAPLAVVDLAAQAKFLLGLDLSVVASCCSVQLDPVASAGGGYVEGPRVLASVLAPAAIAVSVLVAWLAARKPRAPLIALAGALSFATFPIAVAATVLEVAPHAFEVPQHHCPFCLLRSDVWGLGYALYGALFLAIVWTGGAGLAALFARGPRGKEALVAFASRRLRLGALAWIAVLVLGILPIVRYAVVSGGAPLFP